MPRPVPPTCDRNQLIEEHIQLPEVIASRRVLRNNPAFDDIAADGYAGLVEAANAYDPNRGTAFSTYAWYRIRGAMIDGARRHARHVSRTHEVPPHDAPSLEEARLEGVADPSFEESIDRRRTLARLSEHLSRLPEREQQIAKSHYFAGRTIQETAAAIGHSEFTTSRIHARMLRQLRAALTNPETP